MAYSRCLIMRNKPRIRFKGFTEDWEQRKVNDLFKITRGQVLATSLTTPEKTSENIYPVYSSQTKNNGLMGYYSEYLFEDAITWTTDGANAGTVNFRPGRFYSTNVNGVLINENGYACYAVSEIINKVAYKYVSKVGNPKLMNNVMADIDIIITSDIAELGRISALIEAYNQYITLHQRKLEKLKLTKKALLQKLFPKNGSQFPEIRFKGFTDAWEQCKFVDLLDLENGIRRGPFGSSLKKDSFVKKSDYVVYEQQNAIYDNYETRYFISREKYNELIRFNIQPGDFIMSGAGTIGRISMVPDGIKKGVFNQALIRFKVNKDSVDPLYFLKFMQSDTMQKQLTQANPGSAMTNLVPMDELKKWNIVIPSFEEQNRISTFIKQIDDVITLHQRKLDKLQDVKKGLLQKMFV